MRRWRWCGLALAILWLSTTPAAMAGAPDHVIMISIDGLAPAAYLPGRGDSPALPNLKRLMDRGSYARRMIGVFPTLTYPSHTTLVTGAVPARHGIVSNYRRDGSWYRDAGDIRVKTLWQAAAGKGLRTAIVTWPVSFGAQVDYLIPEDLDFTATDLRDQIRQGATKGLFDRLEQATGRVDYLPFRDAEAGVPLDRATAAFAAEIIRRDRPNLLLVHFLDYDHRQHLDGPGSPAAARSLAVIDGYVGKLQAAAQAAGILARTTFVVVGDHGFLAAHTAINVARLLDLAGFPVSGDGAGLYLRMARGSLAIYPVDTGDQELAGRLETAVRAVIGERLAGLVEVIPREALAALGGFPGAVLALAASPGYIFTDRADADLTVPSAPFRGAHGHAPDQPGMASGFIIAGAGIRRGVVLPLIRMVDVAPTIAALLGLRLDAANGVPIAGLLEAP